jgi:hypothetical protein
LYHSFIQYTGSYSITLCYRILHFTFLPPWTYSVYYTFLPYFNSLYIMLSLCHFNSLYIPLLLCHSICFIIHKVFYTLILLSVIYFRYTTYSICISSSSDESKKLPDDGRLLPKHVGACVLNKGLVQFSACVGCFRYNMCICLESQNFNWHPLCYIKSDSISFHVTVVVHV